MDRREATGVAQFCRQLLALFLLSYFLLGLLACGSGGSSFQPPPPPVPDFDLSVSPNTQTVTGGGSIGVLLSATAINGFSSQVSVQVGSLPAGVSFLPSIITLTPGTPQQITFSATANSAWANSTVTFTGTAGSISHSVNFSLSVESTFGSPSRTRYVRTDATTEYFLWPNQNWIVYNPITSRFFVTDPIGNHVIVMDAKSETEIGSIAVPGAYGIDDTPDHTALYVASLIGGVYKIDPVSMTVTAKYMGSQIGPHGYLPFEALVLADGRLALLGSSGGILGVDGSINFAIWSPTDNSFAVYGGNGKTMPCVNIFEFTRTPDRTKVIVGGGTQFICEIDEVSGNVNSVKAPATGPFVITPNGQTIIVPAENEGIAAVNLYDASTLTMSGTISFNLSPPDLAYVTSADSTILFLMTDGIIYAYSLATGQQIGWVPNIYLPPISGGLASGPVNIPYLQAVDNTGLFAGPLEEGVGFIDLSVLQSLPVGTGFLQSGLDPAAGTISGGTQTQWGFVQAGKQGSVYFGNQRVMALTNLGSQTVATTPPGSPGPVTIYGFSIDGGMQMIPEGFSYGPTILEVSPNIATAEGGGTGYVYGYGLGPINATSIPSDLEVTIGGAQAQITAFSPQAYGVTPFPFFLQFVGYTVPQGPEGTADVTVSNNYGSVTSSGALTYFPPVQEFPLPGSTLVEGIYDASTNLYYFTDINKIQVFSRAQQAWLSPIPIPAPPGTTQRLWGIALSPDGSKLAISDAGANAIYLLDPATPTSVQTFLVAPVDGFAVHPCGIAVSDSGVIYYWVYGGADGGDQFFSLNTVTGTTVDYGLDGPSLPGSDMYLRVAITSDNKRVFLNELGNVFWVNPTGTKVFPASVETGCCGGDYELSLTSNQTGLTATSYLYDLNLNAQAYYALNDREILNFVEVYGAKFSADGRLLFQPTTNGIAVLDGELGNLLNNVSLPMPLSTNYDALVADGTDNILVAITGNGDGIALVDLTSIPEPSFRSNVRSGQQVDYAAHPNVEHHEPQLRFRLVHRITNLTLPASKAQSSDALKQSDAR